MEKVKLKEFLCFLSSACKINAKENLTNMENDINLDELTSNALIVNLFDNCEHFIEFDNSNLITKNNMKRKNSHSFTNKSRSIFSREQILIKSHDKEFIEEENLLNIIRILKNKLSELLNEGIFDSILSYSIPHSNNNYNDSNNDNNNNNNNNNNISYEKCENNTDMKSTSTIFKNKKKEKRKKNNEIKNSMKNEAEVEIHVYDEVKGFKKDFKCLQSLLVSNMGYFSEITKGQKLEEMDISVHCDITIFEWLMKWIKKDNSLNSTESPKLDCKNVVPIMVSANFLQMRPLFQDCLYYCKTNMNDIIRFSSNLTCLSENILKKLADKLSNTEIQYLKDKKDKIKSRLFCKLITSLNEEEPEKHRGHYASLAYLYFCLNCGKLVTRVSGAYVPCQSQTISLLYLSESYRDPKWNLNDYIKNIWTEHKNWSNTYWRLWSQCHFLYCYMCRTMYAVAFADYCPYHPQQPHFYPMEQFQTTNSPIGRYPCCGSKAIRYETIMMRSGCKLRSHIPKLQTNDDTCIQTIIDSFPDLIKIKNTEENASPFSENEVIANFDGLYRNIFIEKDKLSNVSNHNQGLLKGSLVQACLKTVQQYKTIGVWEPTNDYSMKMEERNENSEFISVGESENSDISIYESSVSNKQNYTGIDISAVKHRNEIKPGWSGRYSIRHNQDNQRDYEEIMFQAMLDILLQRYEYDKQTVKKSNENITYMIGGCYSQIESEWKESIKTKICKVNKTKPSYAFHIFLKTSYQTAFYSR